MSQLLTTEPAYHKKITKETMAFASKLLHDKEAKQAPGIRERNALLLAMRHFHHCLVGKEFMVRTDHKPNLAIQNPKTKVYDSVSDKIMR